MDDLWFLVRRYLLLEVDPATGKPMYPGEDSTTEDGRIIDRYFGD